MHLDLFVQLGWWFLHFERVGISSHVTIHPTHLPTRCPGTAANIKCCVKPKCASGGSCKWSSQCGGTTQSGLCPGPANFKCCTPKPSKPVKGNLPGLSSVQTRNARAIIARAKKDFPASQEKRACYIAITTAFQESQIKILANSKYPASLKYPHDGVGHDHDSVGIFQQRPSWGSTKERMNAVCGIERTTELNTDQNAGSECALLLQCAQEGQELAISCHWQSSAESPGVSRHQLHRRCVVER